MHVFDQVSFIEECSFDVGGITVATRAVGLGEAGLSISGEESGGLLRGLVNRVLVLSPECCRDAHADLVGAGGARPGLPTR